MLEPDSFCFICTYNCHHELVGMLLSLSIHHKNATVYGLIDSRTKQVLDNITPKIQLNLILQVTLDKYDNKNRQQMVNERIWDEFQMQKANVIKFALETSNDTQFLDSDIVFFNPINCIDKSKDIGLSPHYVKKSNTDEVGYYNGGCLWVKNKNVPDDWIEFTKTSRYHDQASLEDLAKKYTYQEFGEEINFMPWRIILVEDPQRVINKFDLKNGMINYNNQPVVYVHTHFCGDNRFQQFNNLIITFLTKLRKYKELAIINRIIHDKWVIKIPKQPLNGIWKHNNDSFRELAILLQKNNADVKIKLGNSGHCWMMPNICLYDRPTSQWFNHELMNTSLVLLGNGDINNEGNILKKENLNVKPWIFWPRRPAIMEKFLDNHLRKSYNERTTETIFIGNIENSVQNKFRNTKQNWADVLTEYYCTQGFQHKFSQEQYLEKLSNGRFGLALRGFGSKCHREVELMALGTVPIVTPEVSIKSYIDPPIENQHFIRCNKPEELNDILSKISQEQWEIMSINCYEWYQKNVHSSNSFSNFLNDILYN